MFSVGFFRISKNPFHFHWFVLLHDLFRPEMEARYKRELLDVLFPATHILHASAFAPYLLIDMSAGEFQRRSLAAGGILSAI